MSECTAHYSVSFFQTPARRHEASLQQGAAQSTGWQCTGAEAKLSMSSAPHVQVAHPRACIPWLPPRLERIGYMRPVSSMGSSAKRTSRVRGVLYLLEIMARLCSGGGVNSRSPFLTWQGKTNLSDQSLSDFAASAEGSHCSVTSLMQPAAWVSSPCTA